MRRLLSLAALGVVAAGLMLATPATSQAQAHHGHGGSSAGHQDRGYAGGYGGRDVDRGFSPGYGGSYSPGYAPGYGGYYGERGVNQHPTSAHGTPGSGMHTYGHIHVPHRGHSHSRPY